MQAALLLVPGTGLEPVRPLGQGILSPSCLPIPPSGHQFGCKDSANRVKKQILFDFFPDAAHLRAITDQRYELNEK